MSRVEDAVKNSIAGMLGFSVKELKLSQNLNDLGADSLDVVEIIMMIEDELNIELSDEELENAKIKAVGDLVNFVERIVNPSAVVQTTAKKEKIMSKDKPKNHNKRWTNDDTAALILSYAAGTSIEIIAKDLGRTVISILDRLRGVGLVQFNKEENAYFTVPSLLYKF